MTTDKFAKRRRKSKFGQLNAKQREKCAPIVSNIMKQLQELWLDEVKAILDEVKSSLNESSRYYPVHIPERDMY